MDSSKFPTCQWTCQSFLPVNGLVPSFLPVNGLVQISVHLAQKYLQPLLGLLRGQLVKLLGLLPRAEDGLVIEPMIMTVSLAAVPRVPRTERPVRLPLTTLSAHTQQPTIKLDQKVGF